MGKDDPQNMPLFAEFNGTGLPTFNNLNKTKRIVEHNSKLEFDLIINSPPKTGTTWLRQIIYLILNDGTPAGSSAPFQFFEMEFYKYNDDDTEKDNTLRIMFSHLPTSFWQNNNNNNTNNGKTKFIFTLRNPKDVVVSFYPFLQKLPEYLFDGTFDQFFQLWLNGDVPYGDYFDRCLESLSHRNNPNVLLVLYENLIRNTREEIARIAGFIDEKYQKKLVANDYNNSFMENVLKHSSIDSMKNQITKYPMFFFRKGIIGDWRSHLSAEQSDIIDQKVNEKLSETDLPQIWENDMLW